MHLNDHRPLHAAGADSHRQARIIRLPEPARKTLSHPVVIVPPAARTEALQAAGFRGWLRAALRMALLEPPIRFALRATAAFAFLVLGAMKLSVRVFEEPILGTSGLHLLPGPAGFAQFLADAGAPLPQLGAWLCLTAEIGCGAGLLLGAFVPLARIFTRLFALSLAFDMVVALLAAGVRNALGHPVLREGMPAMSPPWRLPVELMLLACMTYFLLRPAVTPLERGRLCSPAT